MKSPKSKKRRKIDRLSLANFLDHFGMMLGCGIQVDIALSTLGENNPNPELGKVSKELEKAINRGLGLSESMALMPDVFPPTVLTLVQVGEESGSLAEQLRRAGELLNTVESFLQRLKKAVTGPAVSAGFCLLILFGVINRVFPKFISMYDSMDIEFPLISKVVLTGVSLLNHPLTLLAVGGLCVGLWWKREQAIERIFVFLLLFPATRPILGKVLCATTCETLVTLHGQGVPLHRALSLICKTAPYRHHREKLGEARKVLVHTGSLHEALKEVDYFPDYFHSMLAIGEETGALEELLMSCRCMLTEEIELLAESVSSALEPAITSLMGLTMGILFIGMFLPIYGLLAKLGSV